MYITLLDRQQEDIIIGDKRRRRARAALDVTYNHSAVPYLLASSQPRVAGGLRQNLCRDARRSPGLSTTTPPTDNPAWQIHHRELPKNGTRRRSPPHIYTEDHRPAALGRMGVARLPVAAYEHKDRAHRLGAGTCDRSKTTIPFLQFRGRASAAWCGTTPARPQLGSSSQHPSKTTSNGTNRRGQTLQRTSSSRSNYTARAKWYNLPRGQAELWDYERAQQTRSCSSIVTS